MAGFGDDDDVLDGVARGGAAAADALERLGRRIVRDGVVDADEVERLLEVEDRVRVVTPEWAGFFTDIVARFVATTSRPGARTDAARADWLVLRVAEHARPRLETTIEALVRTVEAARPPSPRLVGEVFAALRRAVGASLDAGPPTRARREAVLVADLVRRLARAAGGRRGDPLPAAAAADLFDIDATIGEADPSGLWPGLFASVLADPFVEARAALAADGVAMPAPSLWEEADGAADADDGLLGPVALGLAGLGDAIETLVPDTAGGVDAPPPSGRADLDWLARRIAADPASTPGRRALAARLALAGLAPPGTRPGFHAA